MAESKKRIFLSVPHMGGGEMKFINKAFKENWVAPLGPNVDNFEKDLASYTGVKYAAALSSGTAAIHLALIILGVKPGDYVIVQSFTFSATVNPIVYCGATPVLVDSEKRTWNMDPGLLEKAILRLRDKENRSLSHSVTQSLSRQENSRIKAIIPVHLYGMPANMEAIMKIADKYEIPVIEDAAEALGSKYNKKPVGTFGKMGVLSFNGNKIITTSGGGALISDNEHCIKKARFLATQAKDKAPHYQHSEIGYNYRMSNIVAGIGRGQMEVIEERVKQRRANFNFYKSNLSGIKGVSFINEPGPEYFSNRWLTTILIDPDVTGTDRDKVRIALEEENIETRPLWKPMHLQPVFEKYPAYVNGISENLFNKGLCLPSGSNLTEEDKERVLNCLYKCFKK
jgi:aminotransferase in exopolysaccharide biosynthesis